MPIDYGEARWNDITGWTGCGSGAFGLLIFYHIGMVFVTWGFHVKTANPADWVAVPMLLTNAWRLTLLFVVSGFASRALFAKSAGIRGFLGNRNARLLLPLLFGVVLIVPPQSWVELVTQHGYTHGFLWFLTHDYFRFGTLDGVILPTWNHLWFVVYLWAYTLALALMLTLATAPRAGTVRPGVQRIGRAVGADRVAARHRMMPLFQRGEDSHDLIHDGIAHLAYFPAFLFGLRPGGIAPGTSGAGALLGAGGSAGNGRLCRRRLGRDRLSGFRHPHPADRPRLPHRARGAMLGQHRRPDRRGRALLEPRQPLAADADRGGLPFYIIHQTVIILVEYWLKPLGIGPIAEFAILVPTTVAGCWAFYLIGREIGWLRPLIGLRRKAAAQDGNIHCRLANCLTDVESRAVRPPRPGHDPPCGLIH